MYPVLAAEIGHVKNHPCGADFEDMECYGKQLSLGWVRGQEVPGEGATSVAVRIKGLMQRIKNRVSRDHEEISGEAIGKSAILEMPVPRNDYQEQQ